MKDLQHIFSAASLTSSITRSLQYHRGWYEELPEQHQRVSCYAAMHLDTISLNNKDTTSHHGSIPPVFVARMGDEGDVSAEHSEDETRILVPQDRG
jgi:hypothetical protein